jgi:hypothetical protein
MGNVLWQRVVRRLVLKPMVLAVRLAGAGAAGGGGGHNAWRPALWTVPMARWRIWRLRYNDLRMVGTASGVAGCWKTATLANGWVCLITMSGLGFFFRHPAEIKRQKYL